MARIRSIHPGLLSDEAFMTLTIEHPVCIALLLGLWMEADDDGVFEWKPLTIKAKTLPAAIVDINESLETLCSLNFIRKYTTECKNYGAIRNFKIWQRPKLPKVKWPKTPEIAAYVGDTSPALPQYFPSDGETSPQRKEVGEEDSTSLRSDEKEKARAQEDYDFQKWFSTWPSYASDDETLALQSWLALTPDEREAAAKNTTAYVAAAKGGGRTAILPANRYLSGKMWLRVKAQAPPSSGKAITNASKHLSREDYIRAEIARSERSFQR